MDECVNTLAIVLILIATSQVFGNCLTLLHVPELASNFMISLTDNRVILIILLNVILLVLGIIMDMAPIILIATPILLPIATGLCGLDPVQFGIIVVLNCGIDLLTPGGRGSVHRLRRSQAAHGEGGQGYFALLSVHDHRPAADFLHPGYQPCHSQTVGRL